MKWESFIDSPKVRFLCILDKRTWDRILPVLWVALQPICLCYHQTKGRKGNSESMSFLSFLERIKFCFHLSDAVQNHVEVNLQHDNTSVEIRVVLV